MTLTLKTYPNEWGDDVRMNSLYAPFRKRELNPIDFESKMTFWKNLIISCLNENSQCSFSVIELENTFVRNDRKPMCLSQVIGEMLSEKEINYLSDFEALLPNDDSWAFWAVKTLVSTPVMWSFSKFKESLISPVAVNYDDKQFVCLSVVRNKAGDLLKNINDELRNVLIPFGEIESVGKKCAIRKEDLNIVIHWLVLEGQAIVTAKENEKLVKFAVKGEKVEPISDADVAIFVLKKNERKLLTDVENLELQKQETIQNAKEYLSKGMRQMAKSCLRKKKELEKQIIKHVAAIDNTQLLLTRIHETQHSSKVFDTYKVSLSALKNQFKEAGLTEENVSNTMSQVQEVLDIQDDIQSILGEPTSTTFTADEDYEAELEEILKNKPIEKTPELDIKQLDLDLPEPPSVSPSTISMKGSKNKSQMMTQALP